VLRDDRILRMTPISYATYLLLGLHPPSAVEKKKNCHVTELVHLRPEGKSKDACSLCHSTPPACYRCLDCRGRVCGCSYDTLLGLRDRVADDGLVHTCTPWSRKMILIQSNQFVINRAYFDQASRCPSPPWHGLSPQLLQRCDRSADGGSG
jgi:hypothetical protein